MDIVDFFNSSTLGLPKVRPQGDFEAFLGQVFSEYIAAVGQLSGSDPATQGVKAALTPLQTLCQEIREAVGTYFDGFPHGAFDHLQQGINAVHQHVDRLASNPNISPALQTLYRVRLGTLDKFQRPDLFHIPFQLRHKVTTKRYSIPGLPSLYLGGSLWVCWEELGRPDFHSMHVAQFRAASGSKVQVLDFGYRPALVAAMINANQASVFGGGQLTEFVISQAVCWPLIAACSVKVLHPGSIDAPSPFVPEYVVPQLVLQWLRTSSSLDGLRYFSTKISQYVDDPTVSMNYVFPVRHKAAAGHCPILRQNFILSDPIAWSMLRQADLPAHHPRNPTWEMELADGVRVAYLHTDFWDCESKLDLFPCKSF